MDKVIFKLLLVLTWNVAAAAGRCNEGTTIPVSCISNTNIELTKQNDHYDLQLCSNGRCLPAASEEKWIRCDRMCDACASVVNASFCGTREWQCERIVSRNP